MKDKLIKYVSTLVILFITFTSTVIINNINKEREVLILENENLLNEVNLVSIKNKALMEENNSLHEELLKHTNEINKLNKVIKEKKSPSRGISSRSLGKFVVTCYDLSVQSCGKSIGSKGYGITASGVSLKGHTWQTARAIAVDPKVIPLGSKVELTFTNKKYSKYNGVYKAVDTGGAIKGNKIDFFLGDFNQNKTHQSVWDFGKTEAIIRIIDK